MEQFLLYLATFIAGLVFGLMVLGIYADNVIETVELEDVEDDR